MHKSSLTILAVVVLANIAIWTAFNRPVFEQDWRGTIRGVSFSPYRKNEDPFKNRFPTPAEIDGDLQRLEGKVAAIRTYSSTDGLEMIPALAARHHLRVTAGAWLDKRLAKNEIEINNLIANARTCPNIDRLIVGNEALLRGDLTVDQLIGYLRRVRSATTLPVSTAEPWHVWLRHPELAREVDFIAIHVLPYWEGVPADRAVDWVLARYRQVQEAFPGKPVVLAEVGWPSGGPDLHRAAPGAVSQARFVRRFLNLAQAQNLDYFVMEAFDQPWKRGTEGLAGIHWGLFDSARHAKFPLAGPLERHPLWRAELATGTLLALAPMALFLLFWSGLRRRGRLFYAILLQVTVSALVWSFFAPFSASMPVTNRIVWGLLLPAQLGLLLTVLVNGLEFTELLWKKRWQRRFLPLPPAPDAGLPRVSLHLALYNEPPEMVVETLDALARLDYPDFEVLVVDNNTVRDEVWQPVAAHCRRLGPRFRFFHLPKWPGFKAGALNFALTQTDDAAEIVGVIDSDYQVAPDWLRTLVPYFASDAVGFVQAPQDNRGWEGNRFKEMINWEYKGFFDLGMVQRNERNAIIQHGTMTLIRRSALDKVGAWGEWCICEDAELGLRLFEAGYEAVYVNHDFGRGLTPDSFAAYKGQRFRWCFGAVQILRRHWRTLLPWGKSPLSAGQRFHFATGWLPWFTDALHLVFTFAGIYWSIAMLLWPWTCEFPLGAFVLPTLGVFAFKIAHTLLLYRTRVDCTWRQRLGAAIAGMGLTHIIARAVFQGLTVRNQPFLRTPKGENKPALVKGLLMAWEELQLLVLLWLAGGAVLWRFGADNREALLWLVLMGVQSLPYLAALYTSLANSVPGMLPLRWHFKEYIGEPLPADPLSGAPRSPAV
jgi:exo-beta-1,3-glucanase (GH17 family)/cellulose synthase/poly-beta-1,6-N-acetylglucosamine synthase-like glycosyltransferase